MCVCVCVCVCAFVCALFLLPQGCSEGCDPERCSLYSLVWCPVTQPCLADKKQACLVRSFLAQHNSLIWSDVDWTCVLFNCHYAPTIPLPSTLPLLPSPPPPREYCTSWSQTWGAWMSTAMCGSRWWTCWGMGYTLIHNSDVTIVHNAPIWKSREDQFRFYQNHWRASGLNTNGISEEGLASYKWGEWCYAKCATKIIIVFGN